METVLKRNLKRSDLINAWKSVKTIRKNDTGCLIKKNRHSKTALYKKEKELALSDSYIAVSLTYSSWLYLNIDTLVIQTKRRVYK